MAQRHYNIAIGLNDRDASIGRIGIALPLTDTQLRWLIRFMKSKSETMDYIPAR